MLDRDLPLVSGGILALDTYVSRPLFGSAGFTAPLSILIFCMSEQLPVNHFQRTILHTRTPEGSFKKREILVPDGETRLLHGAVLRTFYNESFNDMRHLPDCAWVNGAMPGSQLLDGVLPHRNNWTFYKLDIKNAFPSVDIPTLLAMMDERGREIGMGRYERNYLVEFIDEFGTAPQVPGLPLGAPCSPYLFNFYCRDMDQQLAALAEDYGYVYTRYLDDITISSPHKERTMGEDTRRYIRDIIEETPGMKVNHAKSQFLRRTQGLVTITGVSIYPDGRIQPQPSMLDTVFKVFDQVEAEIVLGTPMTDHDVGVVDGYHGVLKSMAVEPYNATMQEAFKRYHDVARLVRSAIITEDYALPGRPPISAERVAEVESSLVDTVFGGAAERTGFALKYPDIWKAFIEKGMFNDLVAKPITSPTNEKNKFKRLE